MKTKVTQVEVNRMQAAKWRETNPMHQHKRLEALAPEIIRDAKAFGVGYAADKHRTTETTVKKLLQRRFHESPKVTYDRRTFYADKTNMFESLVGAIHSTISKLRDRVSNLEVLLAEKEEAIRSNDQIIRELKEENAKLKEEKESFELICGEFEEHQLTKLIEALQREGTYI